MLLRRFNQTGIDQFRGFIATLKTDKTPTPPIEWLLDDALTEIITPHTESQDATFTNRLAAAEYLDKLLTPIGLGEAFKDVGLWSWLALRFFNELCPVGRDGTRDAGEDARWIPKVDENRRDYRHLLLGPRLSTRHIAMSRRRWSDSLRTR